MLLKTLKTVLFLCIIVSAKAQNFVDAVIFKPNGDSILGKINYQEWYINPEFISFKAANSSKIQVFRPKDISKFVIKGKNEIYESAVVDVHLETLREAEARDAYPNLRDGIQSIKFTRDTVFLLMLEKGKVALGQYVDSDSREHFFVQKENERYIELLNIKFKIIGANEKFYFANYKDYQTRLANLLSDCSKLQTDEMSFEFRIKEIQNLINRYNNCVGKPTYSKVRQNKATTSYYVFSGLSLPYALVDAPFYGKYSVITGKPTVPIGVGVEFGVGRELSPVRIGAEMSVAQNTYDTEISTTNGRSIKYNASLFGIHLFPYMKTSIFNKNKMGHSLFLRAGIALSYYPKASYQQTYTTVFSNGTDDFKLEKTGYSFAFSGGYRIKNLSLECKYEPYGLSLGKGAAVVFRVVRVSFVAGYFF